MAAAPALSHPNMSPDVTPSPDNNFGNPPTKLMLRDNILADLTIKHHNTDRAIFDQSELTLLHAFVLDPSPSNIKKLLKESGQADDETQLVENGGTKMRGYASQEKGSLVGFCMARYGDGRGESTFSKDEVEKLREWFENGGGQ